MPEASRAALLRSDRDLESARRTRAADSLAAAVELARAAWSTRVALLGSRDLQTGEAAMQLAESEFDLAHARASDSLARVALDTFTALLGPDHPYVADAEDLLGMIVKNFTGSVGFAVALDHYRNALRIRQAAEGARSLRVATTLHNMANLYRLDRQPDEAYRLFGEALAIRRETLGAVHDEVASTLGGMAFLRAGQGRWAAAESLAGLAVLATPTGPGITSGSLSVRLGLHGQALRRIGRSAEAVEALRRAVAMRESVWVRTPRDGGSSVIAGLGLYRDLAFALVDEHQYDEAFEQMERGSARSLIARLAGPDDQAGRAGLLARVRRVLADDEAIVAWPRTGTTMFVSDYPVYACVVRSRGPVRWVRLERVTPVYGGLGSIREALWNELRAGAAWPSRLPDAEPVDRLARLMWREWFAPLEPALQGVHHLVVCSPDFVASGPLAVLLDDQGRYLGDRYTITYTPSSLVLVRERERFPVGATRAIRPALLVGDPRYPSDEAAGWPQLTGAGDELRELGSRWPTATLLIGADARAERVRALARSGEIARYGVIHFATHLDLDVRRVLESAIVLAPDSQDARASSRIVASEIATTWRLDADLACLATCWSVQGMRSQTEGPMGLHQAFLAAGARAVLATLWPVDDDATALLVRTFYERLGRQGTGHAAEALREAQRVVREWSAPDGARPYAHPAYWSGFVLIGDAG